MSTQYLMALRDDGMIISRFGEEVESLDQIKRGAIYELEGNYRCPCGWSYTAVAGIARPHKFLQMLCTHCVDKLPDIPLSWFNSKTFVPLNDPNAEIEKTDKEVPMETA